MTVVAAVIQSSTVDTTIQQVTYEVVIPGRAIQGPPGPGGGGLPDGGEPGDTIVINEDGDPGWSPPAAITDAGSLQGHPAADFVLAAEKGADNGIATLDSDGLVPSAQLPATGGGITREEAIAIAVAMAVSL